MWQARGTWQTNADGQSAISPYRYSARTTTTTQDRYGEGDNGEGAHTRPKHSSPRDTHQEKAYGHYNNDNNITETDTSAGGSKQHRTKGETKAHEGVQLTIRTDYSTRVPGHGSVLQTRRTVWRALQLVPFQVQT